MARADPDSWGVERRYRRYDKQWVDAPAETVDTILASMGADSPAPETRDHPIITRPGGRLPAGSVPATVVTEDGAEIHLDGNVDAKLPPDVPLGYHTITRPGDGPPTPLIVSPGACPSPEGRRWGWAVQLYAARSAASWGMGDLGDLRRLAAWSAGELGAGFLLLNPLHAALPGVPQQASPYFPSSRCFRNPLYLRVEDVPGAQDLDGLDELAAAGRSLNGNDRIDRDAVYRLKHEALERLWDRFPSDDGFDAYRKEHGAALEGYATFCALAEEHGRPWGPWPKQYRHPDDPAVAEFRRTHERRVRFHEWLQWLVDRQLAEASSIAPLVHDLAVGVDPAGADAWLWQDVLALDMAVGAPPDEFNTKGQDWGLPPFNPWKAARAGYAPFITTVRSAFRNSAGIRLDHVMGLFRLFWVPRGSAPTEGTYVRYPSRDLLDIVALESHRAGAYMVGEDLGTVEDEIREDLAERNVLSYRLLWFEENEPERWPVKALGAITTHDLPTVSGLWTGSDLEAQRRLDMAPNVEGTEAMRDRLRDEAGLDDDAPADEAVAAAYACLARTPCLLLTATLDDALAVERRPNMPGTTDQWPNWSIPLPVPLEEIEKHAGPRRVAELLRRNRR